MLEENNKEKVQDKSQNSVNTYSSKDGYNATSGKETCGKVSQHRNQSRVIPSL